MSLPHNLTSLTERGAIIDALYRVVDGTDKNDISMFKSASTPDIYFEREGRVINGLEAMIAQIFDLIGPMDTKHMMSNIRIDAKEGASTASLTANALAQHARQAKAEMCMG